MRPIAQARHSLMRCLGLGASAALVLVVLALPVLSAAPIQTGQVPASAEALNAKTWIGRTEEIEQYLKTAEIVKIENIGTGVTNPKRAYLAPPGPVDRIAWKPIRPGMYRGYWESYKAEVAAYELDKVLDLQMVPVTVERRIDGDLGAAAMWVAPTRSFSEMGGPPTPPATHVDMWNVQLIRAKMFDSLIYNRDPNLGNWLVDPVWNLILIDHSRSFTTDKKLAHELSRVEANLWERMKRLDEPTLTAALGAWLNEREIRAILNRRDAMAAEIEKLVAARGASDVFIR